MKPEQLRDFVKADESEVKCFDCSEPYPFGLDLILPDQQWKWLFPEHNGNGVLCPACICKRAQKLKSATVLLCWIDRIDWSAPRPEEWLDVEKHNP